MTCIQRPALLFDLDGTLIDSAPDIHQATNTVLAAEGLPELDAPTIRGFVGNGVGILLARCLAHLGLAEADLQHQRMLVHFLDIYEQAVDLTVLYPNVDECLATLNAQGYRMGICTNKPHKPCLAVLRHFRLLDYFTTIVGGDSLPERKPDPAPVRHALALLGSGPAVFIGDSEVDLEAAKATPIPFALFAGGYRKSSVEDLRPDLSFDDFAALPDLLNKHYSRQDIFTT